MKLGDLEVRYSYLHTVARIMYNPGTVLKLAATWPRILTYEYMKISTWIVLCKIRAIHFEYTNIFIYILLITFAKSIIVLTGGRQRNFSNRIISPFLLIRVHFVWWRIRRLAFPIRLLASPIASDSWICWFRLRSLTSSRFTEDWERFTRGLVLLELLFTWT